MLCCLRAGTHLLQEPAELHGSRTQLFHHGHSQGDAGNRPHKTCGLQHYSPRAEQAAGEASELMHDCWLARAKWLFRTSHFPAASRIPRYSHVRHCLPGWLEPKCLLSLLRHAVLEHPTASQDKGIDPQICPQIPRSTQNNPDLVVREVKPGGGGKLWANSIFFHSK